MKTPGLFAVLVFAATFASAAHADITWNWSAEGGTQRGTFTTSGSNTAPLTAPVYVITDAAFTVSPFMPLGSVSDGQYRTIAGGPYRIHWNGSAVTGFDPTTSNGVNGFTLLSNTDIAITSNFGANDNGVGPGLYMIENLNVPAVARGDDLVTTLVLAPEPAMAGFCLSLMTLAGRPTQKKCRAAVR